MRARHQGGKERQRKSEEKARLVLQREEQRVRERKSDKEDGKRDRKTEKEYQGDSEIQIREKQRRKIQTQICNHTTKEREKIEKYRDKERGINLERKKEPNEQKLRHREKRKYR